MDQGSSGCMPPAGWSIHAHAAASVTAATRADRLPDARQQLGKNLSRAG